MANINPTSPVYSSSTLINSLLKRVNNGSNDTTVMYSQDINWSDILVEDINDMLGATGHVDHFNETAEVLTVLDKLFQEIYKGSNGILARLDALEQGSKTLTLSKGAAGSIYTNVNVVASTSDPITLSTTAGGVFGSTSGATQTIVTGSTNIPVYNKNKGANATAPTITLAVGTTSAGLCACTIQSTKAGNVTLGFTGGIPSGCRIGTESTQGSTEPIIVTVSVNTPKTFYILNSGQTDQQANIQASQTIAGGNAASISPTVTASQQVTGLTGSVSLGTINGTKGNSATGIQTQTFTVPGTPQVTYYWYVGQTQPTTSTDPATTTGWTQITETPTQLHIVSQPSVGIWYVTIPHEYGFQAYDSTGGAPDTAAYNKTQITIGNVEYDLFTSNNTMGRVNAVFKP